MTTTKDSKTASEKPVAKAKAPEAVNPSELSAGTCTSCGAKTDTLLGGVCLACRA